MSLKILLAALMSMLAAACVGRGPAPADVPAEAAAMPAVSLAVNEAGVIGEFFPAGQGGRGPAILLFGGSEGGLGKGARRSAAALQASGFNVLQIAFFKAPGQPDNLELVPLETFDNALVWLKSRAEVDAARIGIIGTSKGGEAALIVAARHPDISAVVANVPSSVSWQGINWARDGRVPEASWSLAGEAVPALPYGAWDNALGIYGLYSNGLKAVADYPDTVIRAEDIMGRILLICGEQDTLWPSCEMSRQVQARVAAAGGREVRLLAYDNAGHEASGLPIEDFDAVTADLGSLGGTPEGNQAARVDSWPRVVAFFRETL